MQKRIAKEEALFYEELLQKEIGEDRKAHGKKPLKDKKDDSNSPASGEGRCGEAEPATQKCSTTDPESGWFRKGEHKHVFAYSVETACDKHGWILGYTVSPGNFHDSRTFKGLYDKIKDIGIRTLVADAGYKTPAIAKLLTDAGIKPLLPYKRPMTKEGYFRKYEYIRHTTGMKELYARRKETIERLFGTAKESHGFRYTQMIGKARMELKAGLTFACMNLKKLAKMKQLYGLEETFLNYLLIKTRGNRWFKRKSVLGLVS